MMMAAAPLTSGSLGCRNFMHMILTAILFLSLPAECGGWVVPVPSRLTTMWRLMNSGPELLPLDRRNRHYDRLVKLRRWENSENGKRITTMVSHSKIQPIISANHDVIQLEALLHVYTR